MGAKKGMFWLPMCLFPFDGERCSIQPPTAARTEKRLNLQDLLWKKSKILTDIIFPTKPMYLAGCVAPATLSSLSADVPVPVLDSIPPEPGPSRKAGGEALVSLTATFSIVQQYIWDAGGKGVSYSCQGWDSVPFPKQLSLVQPPGQATASSFPPPNLVRETED